MAKQKNAHLIAADQRLSQSLIWQLQREYFLGSGPAAWQDDVVPHQISSNPLLARAYSQLILGYWRDCATAGQNGTLQLNPEQPIYIIELGAGSGRLAHHLLHQFHPLWTQSPYADIPFKLVLTDFVPQNVAFWRSHERFRPWFEAGLLDVALFDVMAPRPLHLQVADRMLDPAQIQNPLILIANYFFDSIPQDSFVIQDGQLCHNLLSLRSSQPEPDLADPTLWQRLELVYEAIPLAETPYAEESYNQILDEYEAHLPDTTVTFPNVGLDCLRFWRGFGHGRLLLLTSDRGYTLPGSLPGQGDPLPNWHGSFSLMVNYNAINRFVALNGGLALHTEHYQDNLQTAVYLLGQHPQNGLEVQMAFRQVFEQGGPEDFFALRDALTTQLPNLSLPQMLSCLRLSAFDADIFHECFPALKKQLKQADPVWFEDVQAVLNHIWQQYLPLHADDELAGHLDELRAIMGFAND